MGRSLINYSYVRDQLIKKKKLLMDIFTTADCVEYYYELWNDNFYVL